MYNNRQSTSAMAYNAAVEDFQGIEYPMLQGKSLLSFFLQLLTTYRQDVLGSWRYYDIRQIPH
jgi:hypothetical protein